MPGPGIHFKGLVGPRPSNSHLFLNFIFRNFLALQNIFLVMLNKFQFIFADELDAPNKLLKALPNLLVLVSILINLRQIKVVGVLFGSGLADENQLGLLKVAQCLVPTVHRVHNSQLHQIFVLRPVQILL